MFSSRLTTATVVGWAMGIGILSVLVFFPPGRLEELPPICISQVLFDLSCWGCGMVRATSSLIRAQFAEAYHYNWRVFIVVPILAYAGLRPLWRSAS